MLTDHGRAHCIRRLSAAKTIEDLRNAWERLGVFPQNDPEVKAHKDKMKARLSK